MITIADLSFAEENNEMMALIDDEQMLIHGGWVGLAIGGAGLALAGYCAFTTEKERMQHRNAAKRVVVGAARKAHGKMVVC